MRTLVPVFVVAGLIIGVGVYHGVATDRWADPSAIDHPAQKIAALGMNLGDWHGEVLPRDGEDDPKTSVLHCRFTHQKTGKWIMTAVSTGKPGYIAVHNPEHCYLGSGYKVVDSIRRQSVPAGDGSEAQFWTGHFQKGKAASVESIRIHWAWTTDGRWKAPDYPRFFFAGRNTLHKLYFIHAVTGHETPEDIGLYRDFMQQYLAQLNKCIAK